jgi:hypothetical protein
MIKIHSPNTLVRSGVVSAMQDVVNGDRVVVRVGAASFGQVGVRGTRLQGNSKAPADLVGRVFALVELTDEQIEKLEAEHNGTANTQHHVAGR